MYQQSGAAGAERFVTEYTNACLERVDEAYGRLVEYLAFKYLYSYAGVAPPVLPQVQTPAVSQPPSNGP